VEEADSAAVMEPQQEEEVVEEVRIRIKNHHKITCH